MFQVFFFLGFRIYIWECNSFWLKNKSIERLTLLGFSPLRLPSCHRFNVPDRALVRCLIDRYWIELMVWSWTGNTSHDRSSFFHGLWQDTLKRRGTVNDQKPRSERAVFSYMLFQVEWCTAFVSWPCSFRLPFCCVRTTQKDSKRRNNERTTCVCLHTYVQVEIVCPSSP